MPVLSKIHPVKCWNFAKRRRFPVRFPRFTVIVPDFQRSISAPIISQVFFSRIPEPARGVRITGRRAELGDRLGAEVRKPGQVRNSGNQVLCGKPRAHGGLAPSESIIAIIYLQWVVFGMIFEELNPARHWLVLPVGIKGRSPKSIAGKIEQSDMSFRPINGFVSYSVLKKDIVFCPKCSGFGIPVQQNSLDNFLRVPIERKLTGNKVLVFAMLCIQICFFDDKSFLNPRII